MTKRRPQPPSHLSGHRRHDRREVGRSTRGRRSGWLLFAMGVSAIAAGVGTGNGLVLAAGLALTPAGLYLIYARPDHRVNPSGGDRGTGASGPGAGGLSGGGQWLGGPVQRLGAEHR